MSEQKPQFAFTYIFTWMVEPGCCDKCLNCVGPYEGQSIYQPTLVHPEFGDIWDLALDHSLAHPNCRCKLTVKVTIDWDSMPKLQKLIETANGEEVLPKGTETVTVTVPVGEIDLSSVSELKSELGSLTGKVDELEQKSGRAELTLRQEIRTLNIMMMMLTKFSGDSNIDKAVQKGQQFIMLAMRIRMALLAVTAASGPWGLLYAGANVAATMVMASDVVMGIGE